MRRSAVSAEAGEHSDAVRLPAASGASQIAASRSETLPSLLTSYPSQSTYARMAATMSGTQRVTMRRERSMDAILRPSGGGRSQGGHPHRLPDARTQERAAQA